MLELVFVHFSLYLLSVSLPSFISLSPSLMPWGQEQTFANFPQENVVDFRCLQASFDEFLA